MELPQALLEQQAASRLAGLRKELEAAGAPPERAEEQVRGQADAAREAAARGLRALFLIQGIAEAENLLVSQEDLREEVGRIAERNGVPVQEVGEYYRKHQLFDQMALELLERKVRRFLRESARVTEPA